MPLSMASCGSRLVAASTRTSTRRSLSDPTGKKRRSSKTRRSFGCRSMRNSQSSSKSSVPSSALAMRPARSRVASVKAPRTLPKSSASTMLSGKAARLTRTKGLCWRLDRSWMWAATISLPEPLSPRMSAEEDGVAATRSAFSITRRMASLTMTGPGRNRTPLRRRTGGGFGRFAKRSLTSSKSMGLVRKS